MIFLSEEWAAALVDSKCTQLMDWKFANLKSFVFVALIPPKPRQKCLYFLGSVSWMWSAVCAPHIIDGSEMNNGQKMNDQKYFCSIFKLMHLVFWLQPRSLGPEIIPTNSFHLVASCNPVEKLVLICKPRPPRSKQRELIRPKIECVHLLRVMAEGKGAAKK